MYNIEEIKDIFPETNRLIEEIYASIEGDKSIDEKDRKYLNKLVESTKKAKNTFAEKLKNLTYETASMAGLPALTEMIEIYDEIAEYPTTLSQAYQLSISK